MFIRLSGMLLEDGHQLLTLLGIVSSEENGPPRSSTQSVSTQFQPIVTMWISVVLSRPSPLTPTQDISPVQTSSKSSACFGPS